MSKPLQTLTRFILAEEREYPGASGELSDLLASIGLGVKIISQLVQSASIRGSLGSTGEQNIQGEIVKELDREADQTLIDILGSSQQFGSVVSEEQDDILQTENVTGPAKYVVAFDPLDGSSNIGTNIPVGTIFSIFKRQDRTQPPSLDDYMRPASELVAAGYSVYGAMTSFVYSCGHGVHGFTLDPGIGEFVLTEANIVTPETGKYFSVNEGYEPLWSKEVQELVARFKGSENPLKGPYSGRYVGSLVSDFDRTLRRGGVFMHPANSKRKKGKLRLLYECMPLGFVIHHAGGVASDGKQSLMEIQPKQIHDRCPFFAGGKTEMELVHSLLQ